MTHILSPEDRKTTINRIFHHYTKLRAIVSEHGIKLSQRWAKKSRKQRKSLLLKAWPSLPESHRTDIQALDPQFRGDKEQCLLWPSLNLEDLSSPESVLVMLEARCMNSPYAFAHSDFNSSRLAWHAEVVAFPPNEQYLMVFKETNNPLSYIDIVSRHHISEKNRQKVVGAQTISQGCLTLRIQVRLYKFVSLLSEYILHDVSLTPLSTYPPKSFPPLFSPTKNSISSLRDTKRNLPYRAPLSPNLERLSFLIAAHVEAATDRLRALIEDPSEFDTYIFTWYTHRREHVFDNASQLHGTLALGADRRVLESVLSDALSYALMSVERWSTIQHHIELITDLYRKHVDNSASTALPENLIFEFCLVQSLLSEICDKGIFHLQRGFYGCPTLRDYFRRTGRTTPEKEIEVVPRQDLDQDESRFRYMKTFDLLFDRRSRDQIGLYSIIDELEYLKENQKPLSRVVSSWVLDQVADLAVVGECQEQIDRFQPWATTFPTFMDQHGAELRKRAYGELPTLETLRAPALWSSLVALGRPYGSRFAYPVERKKTEERTKLLQQAEANLAALWATLKTSITNQADTPKAILKVFQESEPLMTSPWTPSNKESVIKASSQERNEFITSFASISINEPQTLTGKSISQSQKSIHAKEKTRDINVNPSPEPVVGLENNNDIIHKDTFTVSRETMDTFRNLFFTPGASGGHPGEMSWSAFVKAMSSIGFSVEQRYGSVCLFAPPENMSCSRSIEIHMPHPKPRISWKTGRRIGKRLHRVYGWDADTFVTTDQVS